MSFLHNLQEKKRSLTKTQTTVTTISGEKFIESRDLDGETHLTKIDEYHAGYIVDLKPDLQIVEVLPYLAFGSQDVAASLEILKNSSITHILSLGVRPAVHFEDFSYKFIDLLDTPEGELLSVLPTIVDLIEHVKERDKKVFVHCNAGCSRAPSVVIGYLIYCKKIGYDEALKIIGSSRYIKPNDGFVKQLKSWQEKYT